MRRCRIWVTLFALATLLPLPAPADDALSRSLTRQLEVNRERYGIVGQALLVAHDGRVLFRGADGVADTQTRERVTTDQVFAGFSVSKLFLGTLVMQLVEQRQVDLDAPASTYLPDLPAAWRSIAVRDYLDHTSGVPEYFNYRDGEIVPLDKTFPDDLPAVFASLADKPLQFAPGTQTRYTQTNYLVLSALLAAHYRKPYPQVAEERLIRRLGLRHTWLGPASLRPHGGVTSYIGKNGRLETEQIVAWPPYAYGHAGLYATLDDLARFLHAVVSGELVDKQTLRQLWQPRTLSSGQRGWFAAGWEYGESGAYRYVGHDGGTHVRVRILFKDSPDRDVYTIVYLTNGSAKNVWSRVLVDSAMAVVDPKRFPIAALSETLIGYALQTPRRGDARAKARSIRASVTLADAELERAVNNAGYTIRENLGIDPALRVFEVNTVLFPSSANAWDSLAEAYAAKGDAKKAQALRDKAKSLSRRPAAYGGL